MDSLVRLSNGISVTGRNRDTRNLTRRPLHTWHSTSGVVRHDNMKTDSAVVALGTVDMRAYCLPATSCTQPFHGLLAYLCI